MQTKPKSNSVITHSLSEDGSTITFHVQGAGDVVIDMNKLSPVILLRASQHGIIQRISDRAAIGRDPETGKSASAGDKLDAMQELAEHYMTGTSEWSLTGNGGPRGGMLFRALCRLYEGKPADEIQTWLGTKNANEKKALRKSKPVADIIATIEAEQLKAAGIDVEKVGSALLDELK
jgi:hypothetical protein